MANEITVSASLAYSDSEGTEDALDIVEGMFSVTSKIICRAKQTIDFASTVAINLGPVSTPAFCMFMNLDVTNYIDLLTSSSGVIFGHLRPDINGNHKGGIAILELGSGSPWRPTLRLTPGPAEWTFLSSPCRSAPCNL